MATKELFLRHVLELANDTGDAPEKTLDTDLIPRALKLSGFTDVSPGRRVTVAPDADDQAVSFTAAIAFVAISHDYPFSLRLADGETLIPNLRSFTVFADDEDAAVLEDGVLLTGNGQNAADVEIWIVELPA